MNFNFSIEFFLSMNKLRIKNGQNHFEISYSGYELETKEEQ
jgi:hypothetical protein